MNIFTRRNLSVTKQEVKVEYRKMDDKELLTEVMRKFSIYARFDRNDKFNFLLLLKEVPFTRKQLLLVLEKFNSGEQIIAYFYRHLVRCAYFYGVPKIVIENYSNKKETYDIYKKSSSNKSRKFIEIKSELRKESKTLMSATLEMVHRSNSRKAKLNNIIDRIVE